MSQKIIEEGWRDYSAKVLPKNAPQVQIDATRMAWYASAMWLYGSILNMLEPGQDATQGDLQKMTDIYNELQAYRIEISMPEAKPH